MFWHHLAFAQVVINEVHPAPSSGNDWVEIKNISAETISLDGWSFYDTAGVITSTPVFTSLSITAGQYLVFELSNRLNNSGDTLTLKDKGSQIADQLIYDSSQSNMSWSRVPDGEGSFQLAFPSRNGTNGEAPSPSPSPSELPSPTPSPSTVPTPSPSPTIIPSPTPSIAPAPSPEPFSLQLSEVMACPETGEKEWIELYNPDSIGYHLTNWKVKDSVGNSRLVNGDVAAQSFTAFDLSTSILNNDGDTLSFETPEGNKIFTAQLGPCQKGSSFVYHEGDWQETTVVTKNAPNIYNSALSNEEISQTVPFTTNDTLLSNASTGLFNSTSPLNSGASSSSSSTKSLASITAPFYPLASSSSDLLDSATLSASLLQDTQTGVPQNSPIQLSLLMKILQFITPSVGILIGISVLLILSGGIGLYKWYTEGHAHDEENTDFS